MQDPVFLNLEKILTLHRDLIERYGGTLGVRDPALLESAVQMPQAGLGERWLHQDIFEMAAAYLFHLVGNHAFVDGNKRVGASAAYIFLHLNGIRLIASENEYEALVLAVVQGHADKKAIAAFFRNNSRLSEC